MKTLLIAILAMGSIAAYAEEYCGPVGKISTTNSFSLNGQKSYSSAIIGTMELKSLFSNELELLVAAKSNSLDVCVKKSKPAKYESERVIELR